MKHESDQYGRFYGVGVGPGDDELLTIKAVRLLKQTPIIAVPRSNNNTASYAFSIIQELIDLDRQEILNLIFPMRSAFAELQTYWESAVESIAAKLLNGKDVVFITEGDPFLYSTFIYIYQVMKKRHPLIGIEVVPGISSINAASAFTLTPLVNGDERLAIVPATCGEQKLRQALIEFDTIILLKIHSTFDLILSILEELALTDQTVFVSRCSSPEENVIFDVRSLQGQKLDYFSLLIVRRQAFE